MFSQFYSKEKSDFKGKLIKVENPRDVSQFRSAIDRIEIEYGEGVRYIFDSLTGMQDIWADENITYKFFTYSCPRLYDLQTIAYWILEKDAHSPTFKANLRHIAQVAIELSKEDGELFLKVIKCEGRFSKSAFLPKHYEIWEQEIIFPSIGGKRPPNLGNRIRTLRKKLGLSQKELAKQVGLTPSFISQLEKNLISPSLDSLFKLSEKLNTQPVYFLIDGDNEQAKKVLVRRDERLTINTGDFKSKAIKLELLVLDVINKRMEPYVLTMGENSSIDGNILKHKGDEFIYVIKGEIEIEINNERYHAREEDSLYINMDFPSKWINVGKGEAILLYVLSPPKNI